MSPDLHPQVQALLSGVLRPPVPAPPPNIEDFRIANTRTAALLGGPGEPVHRTWETCAETTHGPVRLRWYQPTPAPAQTLILYVHGGAWVAGTLDSYDTLCRALALRTGATVASLEYTLAPEALYPVALHQTADASRNVRQLAQAAGLSPQSTTAAGDSAGAALLAGALHLLSAGDELLPDAVLLIYPVTDASFAYASYDRFSSGYSLTTERMRWFWEQYLGQPLAGAGSLLLDPALCPIHSSHLHRFPPTLVLTAAFDPLHDEGEALAARLRQAGVPVQYIDVPGQIHGFLRFRQALTDTEWGPDAVMLKIASFLSGIPACPPDQGR